MNPLVITVEKLKRIFHCRTYHVELAVAFLFLATTAYLSGKGPVEWLGVFAVFLTFGHAQIADRLAEMEERRGSDGGEVLVKCHHKLKWYFYAKEILWFAYFFILQAYSALVGVALFALYQPWRKLWRKYHPIKILP